MQINHIFGGHHQNIFKFMGFGKIIAKYGICVSSTCGKSRIRHLIYGSSLLNIHAVKQLYVHFKYSCTLELTPSKDVILSTRTNNSNRNHCFFIFVFNRCKSMIYSNYVFVLIQSAKQSVQIIVLMIKVFIQMCILTNSVSLLELNMKISYLMFQQ